MQEGINKDVYNPELGATNRYDNAPEEFKRKINEEALNIVKRATPLLEKLEANPKLFNFHDPMAEGKWMGEYLTDLEKEKLTPLYGSMQVIYLKGIPEEVVSFLTRIGKLKEGK